MIRAGFKIDQFKGLFFDSARVMAATTAAERKVLSRFGAFVRTRARSSIRKRKRPSAPGSPPSSHVGLPKRFIFFAYEPQRRNVVIGPARFAKVDGAKVTGDAPAALEYGGRSRVVSRRRGKRVMRKVDIAARPFMQPAFDAEKPRLPSMWANSIK